MLKRRPAAANRRKAELDRRPGGRENPPPAPPASRSASGASSARSQPASSESPQSQASSPQDSWRSNSNSSARNSLRFLRPLSFPHAQRIEQLLAARTMEPARMSHQPSVAGHQRLVFTLQHAQKIVGFRQRKLRVAQCGHRRQRRSFLVRKEPDRLI